MYLIFLTALATGCEKEIDVNLRTAPPRLVIEAEMRYGGGGSVRLTKTTAYDNMDGYPVVEDAVVTISDSSGESETLEYIENGMYTTRYMGGFPGETYTLKVLAEGKEYTSTSTMPELITIDSLTTYSFPMASFSLPLLHYTADEGGAESYTRIKVFVDGENPKININILIDNTGREGPVSQIIPLRRDDFGDKKRILLTVELQSIDKSAYTYFRTLSEVASSQSNPAGNIEGGALGYLSAYAPDRINSIMMKPD